VLRTAQNPKKIQRGCGTILVMLCQCIQLSHKSHKGRDARNRSGSTSAVLACVDGFVLIFRSLIQRLGYQEDVCRKILWRQG
jgi:hypothetical protein